MTWKPITRPEFDALVEAQIAELDATENRRLARYRVTPWLATIRRSEMAGDEKVYVIAQHGDTVLYFDDVEYGWNPSQIDSTGRILVRGGSQCTLKGAIYWLPAS